MNIDELLGIDTRDPLNRRARRMVEGDRQLLVELRDMRERKRLSQQDVAERMQISQSAVARIESGERDPRLSTLRRYAMAVGAIVEHEAIDDERPVPIAPGQHVDVAWPEDDLYVVPSKRAVRSHR